MVPGKENAEKPTSPPEPANTQSITEKNLSVTEPAREIEVSNGFTILSESEKEELKSIYDAYKRNLLNFEETHAEYEGAIQKNRVLSRRATLYLEERNLGYNSCTLLLLEHAMLRALFVVDAKTARATRLLMLLLSFMGEVAVSGYLLLVRGTQESSAPTYGFWLELFVYALISIGVIMPVGLFVQYFLCGYTLKESMSRSEIEWLEQHSSLLKKIGYVLSVASIGISAYCIAILSLRLEKNVVIMWSYLVAMLIATKSIIVMSMKVAVKIILGIILMQVAKLGCLDCGCVSRVLDAIIWLFC